MTALGGATTPVLPTNTAATSSARHRTAAAAQQFESVLLGQWLTEAESSFGTVPGSEQSDDPGANQMNGFAMQHLADEIAKKGGIGIARLVEDGLMKSDSAPGHIPTSIHASAIEE